MKRLLISVVTVLLTLGVAVPAHADTTRVPNVPVLWVHGIINTLGGCAGIDTAKQAAPFASVLASNGYTGPVVGVDYYCGDKNGMSILNAAGTYGKMYNNNVPIERLGQDFAWAVYNNYTSKGQYVSVAAHSMGGLITAYALTHVGQSGFPPSLLVQDVVTFSTPYAGTDRAPNVALWCGSTVQCTEGAPGSAFVTDLAKQAAPAGVDWTTMGGGPADTVDSYASSSAFPAQHKINYYSKTPVNYNHNTYISDQSLAVDEPLAYTNSGQPTYYLATAKHSLNLAALAMITNTW